MKLRPYLYSLLLLPLVVVAVFSCSEDRATDIDLTNLKQITDLVKIDAVGRTAFPRVWIDTVSRLEQYSKVTDVMDADQSARLLGRDGCLWLHGNYCRLLRTG